MVAQANTSYNYSFRAPEDDWASQRFDLGAKTIGGLNGEKDPKKERERELTKTTAFESSSLAVQQLCPRMVDKSRRTNADRIGIYIVLSKGTYIKKKLVSSKKKDNPNGNNRNEPTTNRVDQG